MSGDVETATSAVSPARARWSLLARVVAAITTVAFFAYFLSVVVNSLPRGPAGDWIPEDPPDEKDRVHNGAGYSIVIPKNWFARLGEPDTYGILASPLPKHGGRLKAGIHVQRFDVEQTVYGFTPFRFQGSPAHLRSFHRESTFDDPDYTSFEIVFERDGRWYVIVYGVQDALDTLPPPVLRYLETFRVDKPESVAPGPLLPAS